MRMPWAWTSTSRRASRCQRAKSSMRSAVRRSTPSPPARTLVTISRACSRISAGTGSRGVRRRSAASTRRRTWLAVVMGSLSRGIGFAAFAEGVHRARLRVTLAALHLPLAAVERAADVGVVGPGAGERHVGEIGQVGGFGDHVVAVAGLGQLAGLFLEFGRQQV